MQPSGGVIEGTPVGAFEAEFVRQVGGRPCVAVREPVSAVHLLLKALGIGPGDEVITASYAPAGVAAGIRRSGAAVVFADIDARTFCLDPDAAAAAVTARTAAIVAGHRFGHPAAMDALDSAAGRHGLVLIEDAGEAQGAALDGRPVGTLGAAAVFGHCVVTQEAGLAGAVRRARRTEDLPDEKLAVEQRAVAERTAGLTARRRARARFLDSALRGVGVPYAGPGAWHAYHGYTVQVPGNGRPDRDAFARALAARGVRAAVPVPIPVHRHPAYRSDADLPRTEQAAAHTLALPVDPELTERQVERIAAVCNALGGLL